MELNSIKANHLLENEIIKKIIDIVKNEKPSLPKTITEKISIYGICNQSNSPLNFLLSYDLQEKRFPNFMYTLLSISSLSNSEEKLLLYVSSPNTEDELVEDFQELCNSIKRVFSENDIDEYLNEINELAITKEESNTKAASPLYKRINEFRDFIVNTKGYGEIKITGSMSGRVAQINLSSNSKRHVNINDLKKVNYPFNLKEEKLELLQAKIGYGKTFQSNRYPRGQQRRFPKRST
jgi:hypothetical protein